MKKVSASKRHHGLASVGVVVLPPLPRLETLAATVDAEIARSSNHLRALARHKPTGKPNRQTYHDVAPNTSELDRKYNQHHAVLLEPLQLLVAQDKIRRLAKNNNDPEDDLRDIWRIASTTAKQQQLHKSLESTPEKATKPYISRQIVMGDNQDEGAQYGTTLARYRRLVGMHARKTLHRIVADATRRIAQQRRENACAAILGRLIRRFLGRRRRQRLRYAQIASVETLQCFWRYVIARSRLRDLREQRNQRLKEIWFDELRKNVSARKIQRCFRHAQARGHSHHLNRATEEALRDFERRRSSRVLHKAVMKWWCRRERLPRNVATNRFVGGQGREAEVSIPICLDSHTTSLIRNKENALLNGTLRSQSEDSSSRSLSCSLKHSVIQSSLGDVEIDSTLKGTARDKQYAAITIDEEKHVTMTSPFDDKSGWQLESAIHLNNRQLRSDNTLSWCRSPSGPSHPREDNQDRTPESLSLSIPKQFSFCGVNEYPPTGARETVQEFLPPVNFAQSSLHEGTRAIEPDDNDREPIQEIHVVRNVLRRATRTLRNFVVSRCISAARDQILRKRNAAISIQRIVRKFLARCEVSSRRQLHLISLRSELQTHWQHAVGELVSSLMSFSNVSKDVEDNHHNYEHDEEDDLELYEDDDNLLCESGLSWSEVLPTRCGKIPSGLRLDLSHGPASSKAPSLGLWKWSWVSERWEPNRDVFDIVGNPDDHIIR